MKFIPRDIKIRSWWVLCCWIPYFLLNWSTFQHMYNHLVEIFSGQYQHITVSPCGPEPNARACFFVWCIVTIFTTVYSGIIRLISLWGKKKNYLAFIIPFGITFIGVIFHWLWSFYILNSYIHQLGMTDNRQKGMYYMILGIILWCAYSALICYPWKRNSKEE